MKVNLTFQERATVAGILTVEMGKLDCKDTVELDNFKDLAQIKSKMWGKKDDIKFEGGE